MHSGRLHVRALPLRHAGALALLAAGLLLVLAAARQTSAVNPAPPCPVSPDLPYPSAGCDVLELESSSYVEVQDPLPGFVTCVTSGIAQLKRDGVGDKQPNGRDDLSGEITYLKLTGTCNPNNVATSVAESPTLTSTFHIEEQYNYYPNAIDFPADAVLTFFFESTTSFGTVHNTDPLVLRCKAFQYPPLECVFESDPDPVPLYYPDGEKMSTILDADLVFPAPDPTATPTATETATATATATATPRPRPLGGVAAYPDVGSGPGAAVYAGLAAGAAVALALGGLAWRLRQRAS
jgi:hypothetical protein